jgi:hypothetical protein
MVEGALQRVLDRLGAAGGAESAFFRFADTVTELASENVLEGLWAGELAALASDPEHVPQILGRSATFSNARGWALELRLVLPSDLAREQEEKEISTYSCHAAFVVLGPHALTVRQYRLTPPIADVFIPSAHLEDLGTATLSVGAVARIRAGEAAIRLLHARGATTVAVVRSHDVCPIRSVANVATGLASYAMAASVHSSRLELACRMVAEIGEAADVPRLEGLLAHPHHFVRWAAIRAIGQLDGVRGHALLQRALDDAHPDVRETARLALAQMTT